MKKFRTNRRLRRLLSDPIAYKQANLNTHDKKVDFRSTKYYVEYNTFERHETFLIPTISN